MWDTRPMRRVRAIVSGRVQGVSYRASTADEARRLGLAGWVQNRVDGSVELEAEGPPERVAELLTWCEHGPPSARVSGVAIDDIGPLGGETGFSIRRTD